MSADLVVLRAEGLYCPAGDFFIDPWRAVDRAVITHAHADHARAGHAHVLATAVSEGVLRSRLGAALPLQGLAYGEAVLHRGVRISLHPAGHVLGSAQVRLEHGGQVWVASGDYFLSAHDERNPTCEPFEPLRCHCFITESTFGLPVYRWAPQAQVFGEINAWWRANATAGRASVLLAYSFGKAQRVLAGVDAAIGPIVVHPSLVPVNAAYRAAGVALPATRVLGEPGGPAAAALAGALVMVPPMAQAGAWAGPPGGSSLAFASGWMQLRSARRRQGLARGFVLSDHADWPGLQRAIAATGAERIIVTHGQEAVMVRWLREQGLQAGAFATVFGQQEALPADAPGSAPAAPHGGVAA
ncbi:MAG: ligase-associated DNA damage response exonuclease [Burkholderiales bacterium]|nr:ligase-associated DNA damage response exonuclease [Burkholderiales bacterium]